MNSEFFVVGGTLPPDTSAYVYRKADEELFNALECRNFAYILNSRQMGKSSLMIQACKHLRNSDHAIAIIDLSAIGTTLTQEQWYNGLLTRLGTSLRLVNEIEDFTDANPQLSPLERWNQTIRKVVLERLQGNVTIFLDEIDIVRGLKETFSTDEFFASIRAFYNSRSEDPAYTRLSFCLIGVAAPTDLITDPDLTPFNIGTAIQIKDFTDQEANQLAAGLQPEQRNNPIIMERILYWTGGHPYLTQRLCKVISENSSLNSASDVDHACANHFFAKATGEREVHLVNIEQRLLSNKDGQKAAILTLYARILRDWRKLRDTDDDHTIRLKLSGLILGVNGKLFVRNRIYRKVFDWEWVQQNLPEPEKRRQRDAVRTALLSYGSVAGLIIAIISWLAIREYLATRRANDLLKKNAEILAKQLTLDDNLKKEQKNTKGLLHAARINQIQLAWRNKSRDADLIKSLLDDTASASKKGFEWPFWNSQYQQYKQTFRGHTGPVFEAHYSQDGKQIVTCSYDGTAKVWDAKTERCLLTLQDNHEVRKTPVYTVAFSPDHNWIATGHYNHNVLIWNVHNGKLVRLLRDSNRIAHDKPVYTSGFSPDGKWLATGSADATTKIWEVSTWTLVQTLVEQDKSKGSVHTVRFSDDSRRIATGGYDGTVRVYGAATLNNKTTWKLLQTLRAKNGFVYTVAFSHHNSDKLIAGYRDGTSILWDVNKGKQIYTLTGHSEMVSAVSFSHKDDRIVTGSRDGTARIWDAQSGEMLRKLEGYATSFFSLEFSEDDQRIITGINRDVGTWNSRTGKLIHILGGNSSVNSIASAIRQNKIRTDTEIGQTIQLHYHKSLIHIAAFSTDGKFIITGSPDGKGQIWDNRTRTVLHELNYPTGHNFVAEFNEQGNKVVTGNYQGEISIWNVATGQREMTLTSSSNPVYSIAIARDSRYVATGCQDGSVTVFDTETHRQIPMKKHDRVAITVAFSPDGRSLVSGSYDTSVRISDIETGQPRLELPLGAETLNKVAFSLSGDRIITTSSNGAIAIWDAIKPGKALFTWRNPGSSVFVGAFSPDGRQVVTGSADGTARLWDIQTKQPLMTFTTPQPVDICIFSRDGRRLITGSYGGIVGTLEYGQQYTTK